MSKFEVRNRFHSQGLAAGGSALLDAINKGKVHLAKFILDAGEYDVVNTRDFKGKTPLIRACYVKEEKTREKLVQLLLSKNANVNLRDENQRTALSYACEMRCNDVVRSLVRNNVDPDVPDKQGNTALIHSASVGNDVAIEILIRSFRRLGLSVDHVNEEGMTALLVAAKGGFVECASILAADGRANVFFRDPQNGMTAEDWARMRGCSSPEVVPFSVNANQQRLTRCRSNYGGRRATEAHPMAASAAAGYSSALQKSSPSTSDNIGEEETELSTGCYAALPPATDNSDVSDDNGRSVGVATAKQRRKRNSLPSIKLWSSLDLPGQRSTASPVYEEDPPPPPPQFPLDPPNPPPPPPPRPMIPSSSNPLHPRVASIASECPLRPLQQQQRTSVGSRQK